MTFNVSVYKLLFHHSVSTKIKILIYRIYILAGSSPVKASQASHVFLPLRTSTPSERRSSRNRSFSWRGTVCGRETCERGEEVAGGGLAEPPAASSSASPRFQKPPPAFVVSALLSSSSPLPPFCALSITAPASRCLPVTLSEARCVGVGGLASPAGCDCLRVYLYFSATEQIIKAGCRKQAGDGEREVLAFWSETRGERRGFLYQRAARDLIGRHPAALHVCRSVFGACVGESGNSVFGNTRRPSAGTVFIDWNQSFSQL